MSSPVPAPIQEWQADSLQVAVYAQRSDMGAAAAIAAAAAIWEALHQRGVARMIVASAPSQDELLAGLAAADLPWERITLLHMDEYADLAADHPASFRAYQQRTLLRHVRPAAFHGINGEAADTAAECDRYTRLLTEAPVDVVCLGIGENGHLAFNDPPGANFSEPPRLKVVELEEACRRQQVHDGCFPTLAEVPRLAFTLTISALLSARALFCVVPGARKAEAIARTLQGPIDPACPASVLRTAGHARLYLDAASAALVLAAG